MHSKLLYSALFGIIALPAQAALLDVYYMSATRDAFTLNDPVNNLPFDMGSWANSENPPASLVEGRPRAGTSQ